MGSWLEPSGNNDDDGARGATRRAAAWPAGAIGARSPRVRWTSQSRRGKPCERGASRASASSREAAGHGPSTPKRHFLPAAGELQLLFPDTPLATACVSVSLASQARIPLLSLDQAAASGGSTSASIFPSGAAPLSRTHDDDDGVLTNATRTRSSPALSL